MAAVRAAIEFFLDQLFAALPDISAVHTLVGVSAAEIHDSGAPATTRTYYLFHALWRSWFHYILVIAKRICITAFSSNGIPTYAPPAFLSLLEDHLG